AGLGHGFRSRRLLHRGRHLPARAWDAVPRRRACGAGIEAGIEAGGGARPMSMEFLIATGVGALTAAGLYLILLRRTFPVVVGLSFLSYAVNVFLFTMGRLTIDKPPIIDATQQGTTDP